MTSIIESLHYDQEQTNGFLNLNACQEHPNFANQIQPPFPFLLLFVPSCSFISSLLSLMIFFPFESFSLWSFSPFEQGPISFLSLPHFSFPLGHYSYLLILPLFSTFVPPSPTFLPSWPFFRLPHHSSFYLPPHGLYSSFSITPPLLTSIPPSRSLFLLPPFSQPLFPFGQHALSSPKTRAHGPTFKRFKRLERLELTTHVSQPKTRAPRVMPSLRALKISQLELRRQDLSSPNQRLEVPDSPQI